jgi:hypothetical protein
VLIIRTYIKIDVTSRRSFSVKEKHELVQAVDIFWAPHKVSCHQACAFLGISQVYYARFKKVIKMVDNLKNGNKFIPYKINGSAQKIHPWCPRFLDNVKGELCTSVSIARKKGIQVSTHMVCQEAFCLLPAIRDKPLDAQKKAALCFMKGVGLSYQVATRNAQKNFQ